MKTQKELEQAFDHERKKARSMKSKIPLDASKGTRT